MNGLAWFLKRSQLSKKEIEPILTSLQLLWAIEIQTGMERSSRSPLGATLGAAVTSVSIFPGARRWALGS